MPFAGVVVSQRRRTARRSVIRSHSRRVAGDHAVMALPDKDKAFIDSKMAKYDKDHNGVLDEKELKRLLTDLNDGNPPTRAEVRELLQKCDEDCDGKISVDEIREAIVQWYLLIENRSCCCRLM